ncbi:MAG: hypothetical protein LBK76_09865 [Verrucomicrobiales bacterium]|jgi:hypothetical protein|nr:hypothetical protein [Verrucomicrobiales bacterium]
MLKIKITETGNVSLQHKLAPLGRSRRGATYLVADVPRNTDPATVANAARNTVIMRQAPWTLSLRELGRGKIVR